MQERRAQVHRPVQDEKRALAAIAVILKSCNGASRTAESLASPKPTQKSSRARAYERFRVLFLGCQQLGLDSFSQRARNRARCPRWDALVVEPDCRQLAQRDAHTRKLVRRSGR